METISDCSDNNQGSWGESALCTWSCSSEQPARKMQLIFPSWVKPLYKTPQLPGGPNWRHWIMYYQNWLYNDVFMGTSAACKWKGNISQLQGSYLPLACCKQYTTNVKTLARWSDIALSLEIVAQKGEEILGTLLNCVVCIKRSAQLHWSLRETQRYRGFPAHLSRIWPWLLQDRSWAAASNRLESLHVWEVGLCIMWSLSIQLGYLLLQDVTHHGQKASSVKSMCGISWKGSASPFHGHCTGK